MDDGIKSCPIDAPKNTWEIIAIIFTEESLTKYKTKITANSKRKKKAIFRVSVNELRIAIVNKMSEIVSCIFSSLL